MNAVQRFYQRRIKRLESRFGEYHGLVRFDADDEGDNGGNNRGGGHGNTKISFGLCQREGIDIDPNWTPKDAWDALAGKGYSAGEVYKELKKTGKIAKREVKTDPETGEVTYEAVKPMDKKELSTALKDHTKKSRELKTAQKDKKATEKEMDEARIEKSFYSRQLTRLNDQVWDMEQKRGTGDFDREKYLSLVSKVKEANDKYKEADTKAEELRKKLSDTDRQITELEKERKELADKILDRSPYKDQVNKYREIEEESRGDRNKLKEIDNKLEKSKQALRIWEAKGDDGFSKIYARFAEAEKKKIESLEAERVGLVEKVDAYDREMEAEKSGVKDAEWKQLCKLADERDTVQDGPYDKLSSYADKYRINLKYENPHKYIKTPDEESIINKLAGGDKTAGSCASVALAYLANKAGYDVLDFRGGKSQKWISYDCCEMVRDLGGQFEKTRESVSVGMKMLANVEEGKEYWFATGRHAAVVKKVDGKLKYLELQSSGENGWRDLDERELARRFNRGHYTSKNWSHSALIEASKLFESSEMVSIMGYINTADGKQRKGASGGVK